MSKKSEAIDALMDAAAVAVQVLNDYGPRSNEAIEAVTATIDARDRAWNAGATDDEIRQRL